MILLDVTPLPAFPLPQRRKTANQYYLRRHPYVFITLLIPKCFYAPRFYTLMFLSTVNVVPSIGDRYAFFAYLGFLFLIFYTKFQGIK